MYVPPSPCEVLGFRLFIPLSVLPNLILSIQKLLDSGLGSRRPCRQVYGRLPRLAVLRSSVSNNKQTKHKGLWGAWVGT